MSKTRLVLVFMILLLAFLGWWAGMIIITGTNDSHVRIRRHLDEQFFDYIEESLDEKEDPLSHLLHDEIYPVELVIDADGFLKLDHHLFNLEEYYCLKQGERLYLFYRGRPPSVDVKTQRSLNIISYDPTNGTYSEGSHARLIQVKVSAPHK